MRVKIGKRVRLGKSDEAVQMAQAKGKCDIYMRLGKREMKIV